MDDFDDEAEHFLALLGDVRDLLSLAENPRMLSFMIRWYREGLLTDDNLTDDEEPITAGRLYKRLLTTWLEHEYQRQDEAGSPGALSVTERLDALSEVALHLWRSGEASVQAAELGNAAAKVPNLARLPFHRRIAQVEFNAWQYVEGNLWASLLEHLFRNLRLAGEDDNLVDPAAASASSGSPRAPQSTAVPSRNATS